MYKERIETCAQRIRRALEIRNMKQADLCELAKVPKSSLSLYLSGAYEPRQDRLTQMAMVLNVTETWLMGYDVPMERENTKTFVSQNLSEGEQKLLDLFRRVPESQQEMVLQMISVALNNIK